MKHIMAIIVCAIVCAQVTPFGAQARDYPEPPPIVAERIVDERFEPGNFEHLRGYFPEATEQEKAHYAALKAWLDQCGEDGTTRRNAELAELGIALDGQFVSGAANMCAQVVSAEQFEGITSYAELVEASRGARLVFNTLIEAIARAELRTGPVEPGDLGAELDHRTLGEQMLRLAFSWGRQEIDQPRMPRMDKAERTVFLALLSGETMRVDHENTEWLKAIVEKQGWPKISEVGERGAGAAWLLAQHADMDPVFQYRMLGLMEPLVAQGEVSKSSYAYLYDRVMLKIAGKQRYGTQVKCEGGDYVPRPLEEPERLDELRASVELGTFNAYRQNFPNSC